jgi:hypothetical protein
MKYTFRKACCKRKKKNIRVVIEFINMKIDDNDYHDETQNDDGK